MSSRETQNPPSGRSTRSGRRVREPVRYEPDPNVILEDDYSDAEHSDTDTLYPDDCSLSGQSESDDEDFVSEIGDSDDESDFDTDEEPMTEVEEEEDLDEDDEDDEDDIIDFDCLTENASDCSMSSDEED